MQYSGVQTPVFDERDPMIDIRPMVCDWSIVETLRTFFCDTRLFQTTHKEESPWIRKRWRHVHFYHNAYWAWGTNNWKRWQENHLITWNFNTTKKITSGLMSVFEKMSIRFFKQSPTSMNSGKMYIRHLFINADWLYIYGLSYCWKKLYKVSDTRANPRFYDKIHYLLKTIYGTISIKLYMVSIRVFTLDFVKNKQSEKKTMKKKISFENKRIKTLGKLDFVIVCNRVVQRLIPCEFLAKWRQPCFRRHLFRENSVQFLYRSQAATYSKIKQELPLSTLQSRD